MRIITHVPPYLKYAKTHDWVRLNGDTAVVGIAHGGTASESRRGLRGGGIGENGQRHLLPGQRRDRGGQQGSGGQSGVGQHRTLRRRLVLQNQTERSVGTEQPSLTGVLHGADRSIIPMVFLRAAFRR